MSTKNKIYNIKTGEVKRVRIHPSTTEIQSRFRPKGNLTGNYRSRLLALHRAGWRLANGKDA